MTPGKEKLALLGTVALLGWVGTCRFPAEEEGRARTADGGIELPAFSVPDLGRTSLPPPPKDPARRDIFAAPRDVSPLPPLAIEVPPLPALPVVSPPLRPSARIARWSEFYRVPGVVQPFEFPDEVPPAKEPASPPAAGSAEGKRTAGSEAYKKLYDWIRPNPYATLFGRIQNPNRFDLGYPKLRDGESLLFQEIDPAAGKPSGKPTAWPPERVQEYGFADTVANQIEIGKRRISYVAGSIPEIVAFADWCVERGAEEPKGFLEAERLYKKAAELDPGDPSGPLGLGRLYERSFQLEEAYALYGGMAESRFSHRPEPFLHLGRLQARLRLFDLAEASLRRSVEIGSSSPACRAAFAEFFLERDRPEAAVEVLRELRVEPSEGGERARVRAIFGEALLAAGEIGEAIQSFQQALNSRPGDPRARLGLAAALYAKGDFRAGLDLVDAALSEGEASPELFTARGLFALRMGDFPSAERDLRSAIGLDPIQDAYPLAALAFLYERTGHAEEAFRAIEAAATVDPTDPYVRYERARILAAREDLSGARGSIRAVLNGEFRFQDGLIFRGYLSYLAGEHEDAERYFDFASRLDPRNADLMALRGVNLLRGGQVRRAREAFRKALAGNADQPTALAGLGFCAYAEGQTDEAIRSFAEVEDRHKTEDEYRAYAKARLVEIQDHRNKVIWTEDFGRTELRREWKDESRVGPQVRLEGGAVRLEGQARERGRTRIFQERPGRAFLSVEAAVAVEEANQGIVGLQLVAEKKIGDANRVDFEIDVARLRSGKVATRVQVGQVEPEWKEHDGAVWPVGQPVRLSIERLGRADDEPRIRIRLNGEPLGEAERLAKLKTYAGDVRLGVFAEAETGRQVAVRVEEVRVVYREK